jgi:hypothetical protein
MIDVRAPALARALLLESLVAAGPRKSGDEYRDGALELCEDCAGFCLLGEFTVFWLCDGTSNSHELARRENHPGLNVRMLAADLGEGFGALLAEALREATEFVPDPTLQQALLARVAEEWQERLVGYLADVAAAGELSGLLENMPEMADGSYRLEWSSTFLGGVYCQATQTLHVLNLGDSAAVVFGEDAWIVAPNNTCAVLLAKISPDEPLAPKVYPVGAEAQWQQFALVQRFLALSDGHAEDLPALLEELQAAKDRPFGQLRRELLNRGELTYDDKAVVLGQVI